VGRGPRHDPEARMGRRPGRPTGGVLPPGHTRRGPVRGGQRREVACAVCGLPAVEGGAPVLHPVAQAGADRRVPRPAPCLAAREAESRDAEQAAGAIDPRVRAGHVHGRGRDQRPRRREENRRAQAAHRGGHPRPDPGGHGHPRLDGGPGRRPGPLLPGRAAAAPAQAGAGGQRMHRHAGGLVRDRVAPDTDDHPPRRRPDRLRRAAQAVGRRADRRLAHPLRHHA
jgi:hypothetical protein